MPAGQATREPDENGGGWRHDGTVTILVRPLARCPFRGCPVRYASGGDRLCRDHAEETAATWAGRLAELTGTAPGGPGDGDDPALGT
jgi:hypothetical protein